MNINEHRLFKLRYVFFVNFYKTVSQIHNEIEQKFTSFK